MVLEEEERGGEYEQNAKLFYIKLSFKFSHSQRNVLTYYI